MVEQNWSDIYVVFTKILCGLNFCVREVTKLKLTGKRQAASSNSNRNYAKRGYIHIGNTFLDVF